MSDNKALAEIRTPRGRALSPLTAELFKSQTRIRASRKHICLSWYANPTPRVIQVKVQLDLRGVPVRVMDVYEYQAYSRFPFVCHGAAEEISPGRIVKIAVATVTIDKKESAKKVVDRLWLRL